MNQPSLFMHVPVFGVKEEENQQQKLWGNSTVACVHSAVAILHPPES